jgi:hypothetical protein
MKNFKKLFMIGASLSFMLLLIPFVSAQYGQKGNNPEQKAAICEAAIQTDNYAEFIDSINDNYPDTKILEKITEERFLDLQTKCEQREKCRAAIEAEDYNEYTEIVAESECPFAENITSEEDFETLKELHAKKEENRELMEKKKDDTITEEEEVELEALQTEMKELEESLGFEPKQRGQRGHHKNDERDKNCPFQN